MSLINKKALIEQLESHIYWGDSVIGLLEVAKNAPTIDAEPVRHGRWADEDNGRWVCTLCGSWYIVDSNGYMHYCPHCGAKMGGEED